MRDTVPVSILYSTTGPYAGLGREAVAGAMAAISEVNADPTLGFRMAPQLADPAGRTERYSLLAEAAIREQGCRHIIGTITSWSRKDVLPLVERHGGLLWYAFPYEGYEASDSAIYLGACPNQHLLPLFDHALPRFGSRVCILGSNYIWGWEISRLARGLTEVAGGQILSERFVPLGSTEVAHLVAEIRQKQPDLILSNLVGESATAFLAAYAESRKEGGAQAPVVACNLSEVELEGLPASAAAGHISTSIYFNRLETPGNESFRTRMALRHGGQRRITTSFVAAYMSVSILARAMADAGSDQPEAVRRVVTSRLFDTPLGPISIDRRTHHAALRPHLAVSDEEGEFRIFQSAPAPLEADPYLVRSFNRAGISEAGDAPADPVLHGLKVIK